MRWSDWPVDEAYLSAPKFRSIIKHLAEKDLDLLTQVSLKLRGDSTETTAGKAVVSVKRRKARLSSPI
jgi:hypothetical protein